MLKWENSEGRFIWKLGREATQRVRDEGGVKNTKDNWTHYRETLFYVDLEYIQYAYMLVCVYI